MDARRSASAAAPSLLAVTPVSTSRRRPHVAHVHRGTRRRTSARMGSDAVELGIAAFVGLPSATPQVLVQRLEALGVAPWLAHRLVAWIPIAFARGDGPEDDPIFVAARLRADRATPAEREAIASGRAPPRVASALPAIEPGDGGVPEPRETFRAFLEAHGFPGALDVDAFVFPRFTEQRFSVQVDYVVSDARLAGGRLVESFAGLGATYRDAIGNTLGKLERGTVHVVISALIDADACADHAFAETWDHPGGPFRAVLGAQLILYASARAPMGALIDALRDALAAVALSREVHSLRVFAARKGDERYADEVLLDGEPWPEGEALCARHPWPRIDAYWGTRFFALLVPA